MKIQLFFYAIVAILISLVSPSYQATGSFTELYTCLDVNATVEQLLAQFIPLYSPIPPELPNLVSAKRSHSNPAFQSCNSINADPTPRNGTLSWNYYETYPANCGQLGCPHNTSTSTIQFSFRSVNIENGNVVGQSVGTVVAGPYTGATLSSTTTLISINQQQCDSTIGVETMSGTDRLVFSNGIICEGTFYIEICPGIKTNTTMG